MKRKNAPITEGQVQLALRRFQQAGGKIKHIGDQPTPHRDGISLPWGPLLGIAQTGALHCADGEGNASAAN
jgi:hypothetical protein